MKYKIEGKQFPVVIFELNKNEQVFCEVGGMSWMSSNIKMDTNTGGNVLKGIARKFTGESLFLNYYTAQDDNQKIAFASSFPGEIMPVELDGTNSIIAQKRSFLVATPGVDVSISFNKKIGAGFFGGEGFILQRISGKGMAFLEIDGSVVEYTLAAGEKMIIDQTHLAAMESTVTFNIETVKGIKNIVLGGEGLFVGNLIGPGKVWIQTMPFSKLMGSMLAGIPKK